MVVDVTRWKIHYELYFPPSLSVDIGALGLPRSQPEDHRVSRHLQTSHLLEAKLGSSCWSQSRQPVAGSPPCSALPWAGRPLPVLLDSTAGCCCSLCTCRTFRVLAEWSEETAGVIEAHLFEDCPNEKQTIKSGEFHVSLKCTEMQLLSCAGDQRSISNSGCQSVLPGLILDGDLLANFRRKLKRRIMSIKLEWIVRVPCKAH